MKILLMAPQPFFQHRGTPIAVRMLAEVLGQNGHDVQMLVFHEGEDVVMENVTVHRIPAIPGLNNIPPGFSVKKLLCDLLLWGKSISLHMRVKFDCVHAVEESVFMALCNNWIFRVPYIYDLDSYLSDQLIHKLHWLSPFQSCFQWLERRAIHGSVGVVAVCQALVDIAVDCAPDKPVLLLQDISLIQDCDDRQQEDIRKSVAGGLSEKIILYVGNMEGYQGIDLLMHGFAALADSVRAKSALSMIGGTETHIQKYKHLAKQLGVAERVFFLGPRPVTELGCYLSQADILVSPRTEGENTPMKIYSYMDSGKAIVATKIKSHTQVLDESMAMLVPPEPADFAEGLRFVLENDEEAHAFGRKAREQVLKQHSKEVFEEKISGFYDVLFAGK